MLTSGISNGDAPIWWNRFSVIPLSDTFKIDYSNEVLFSVNVLWPLIAHTVHTIAYKILYTVQITIVLIQPLSLIRQRGRMCTIDECAHSSLQYRQFALPLRKHCFDSYTQDSIDHSRSKRSRMVYCPNVLPYSKPSRAISIHRTQGKG